MLNQYYITNKQFQISKAANKTKKNHINCTNLCQVKETYEKYRSNTQLLNYKIWKTRW